MYKREDFFIPGTQIVAPILKRDGVHGIYGFFGPFRCFSNFHECMVEVDDLLFGSSEAAYMAQKTDNMAEKLKLTTLSPGKAKEYGQKVTLKTNWEEIKIADMEKVVQAKFDQNQSIAETLLRTQGLYLEETNWWGDNFWGVDHLDLGQNNLGKILMRVRSNLLG